MEAEQTVDKNRAKCEEDNATDTMECSCYC